MSKRHTARAIEEAQKKSAPTIKALLTTVRIQCQQLEGRAALKGFTPGTAAYDNATRMLVLSGRISENADAWDESVKTDKAKRAKNKARKA